MVRKELRGKNEAYFHTSNSLYNKKIEFLNIIYIVEVVFFFVMEEFLTDGFPLFLLLYKIVYDDPALW